MEPPTAGLPLTFALPARLAAAELASRLGAHLGPGLRLCAEPARHFRRTWLETWDWRLYGQGGALAFDEAGGERRLVWESLHDGRPLQTQPVDAPPRFAADLPATGFRERISRVAGVRALLPLVTVTGKQRRVRVLDAADKTVLRLEVRETGSLRGADSGRSRRLRDGRHVQLLPVRGYERALALVSELLRGEVGLRPLSHGPFFEALAAIGRVPIDTGSSPSAPLDPAERADAAVRKVLLRLLAQMEANEVGARCDIDSEFLHDFRVALRRTRTLLGQMKQVFPARHVERFRRGFAWLGTATGPARDLDVYLLSLPDLQRDLPADAVPRLEPLRQLLEVRRQAQHRRLVATLGSTRYRRLLGRWRAFLEAPPPQRTRLANATRPVGQVADERIWRNFRKALREGAALGPESPAQALHQLRKTCKKLRYLMEFFADFHAPGDVERLIKRLKRLQDNLGEFQDLVVQREFLQHICREEPDRSRLPPATRDLIELLIARLGERQRRARALLAENFAGFAARGERGRYRALYAPAGTRTR